MNNTQKPYINPYIGGIILGIVLFLSFFITGGGLGASGAINSVQVFLVDIFASTHIDNVKYLAKMAGGDKNPLLNGGVFMLLGTVLGGVLSGLIHRRFKAEIRKGPNISNKTRIIMAFLGGLIMGFGARLARGCTSGQGLSGGAVLSVGSFAFMLSLFLVGYLFAYFFRKFWN